MEKEIFWIFWTATVKVIFLPCFFIPYGSKFAACFCITYFSIWTLKKQLQTKSSERKNQKIMRIYEKKSNIYILSWNVFFLITLKKNVWLWWKNDSLGMDALSNLHRITFKIVLIYLFLIHPSHCQTTSCATTFIQHTIYF